jgi:CheY-like chemotaxis protein
VLSHELRTPLTPVLAAVSAELRNGLAPSLRGTFEMIQRNVELEARLIDDLLDLTRLTRGRMMLNMETVDAHAHVRQAMEVCAAAIEQKQHRVQCNLRAERHHVQADPARLQQIFWNLIHNAAKFSPPGSELTVRSRNGAGGELEVEVADSGIGMEPEVLARIFHPFEQAESAISRKYGGLGLGLSLSRAIAEAHGGSISARSMGAGKGSAFTIILPSVPAPSQPASAPSPPSAPVSLRILLVEDSADTLRILARLLMAAGHAVTTAETATAARLQWKAGAFDLLVSDIGLPDGSGTDLVRELGEDSPIRAIAISGYGTEDDIALSREAGFAEHLVKPLDYARLEEAIARVAASPHAAASQP